MTDELSFTCPVCQTVNTDAKNVEMGWCTTCKAYTAPVDPAAQAKRIIDETHAPTRELVEEMRRDEVMGRITGDPSIPRPTDD